MSVSVFNVLSKQNVKLVREVLLKGDKFSTCFSQTPNKFHYIRSIKSPLPSWRPNPILEFSSELNLFDSSVAFLLLTSLPFFKFLPPWCPWDAPPLPALSLLAASPSSQIPLWLLFFHPCFNANDSWVLSLAFLLFLYMFYLDNFNHTCAYRYQQHSPSSLMKVPFPSSRSIHQPPCSNITCSQMPQLSQMQSWTHRYPSITLPFL